MEAPKNEEAAAPPAPANPFVVLTIKYNVMNGELTVDWPPNTMLAYGMLKMAENVIAQQQAAVAARQPKIITPPPLVGAKGPIAH